MEMRFLDWKWGNILAFLAISVSSGIQYIFDLCVACIRIPYGSMNWGPLVIGVLLLHGVLNLIFFCVVTVLVMP